MPIPVIDPTNESGVRKDFQLERQDYGYEYPRNMDLKPGSKLHTFLREMIWRRAMDSYRVMSQRHKEWRATDDVLRAYVPAERAEKTDHDYKEKEVMPKIIMPVSYANLETLLTYMTAAFLQDRIFRFEGTGPEDTLGAILLEEVIHQQAVRSGMGLALHTMWRDGFAYGIGVASPVWHRQYGKVTEVRQPTVFEQLMGKGPRKVTRDGLLYEGNKLVNIDPYRFLPDPNASAHDVQDGEFVGWVERTNYMNLLRMENDPEGFLFNVQYVKHIDGTSSLDRDDARRDVRTGIDRRVNTNNPVDVIWLYVDLIPEEWKLGRGKAPEKWLFALAGDSIIIAAQPIGLDHNMFPVVVCAPDYDGYSAAPASRLGIISDMQNIVDFLFTSHILNVRKAINDMLVVDPSLVNVFDLMDPKPGKLIRLRRAAWGRSGVKDAVQQLAVTDVTQNHMSDASAMMAMMDQVSGSTDMLKGVVQRRGPRVSAAEATGARQSGLSRLEKTARIISMQAMRPLAYMMASHVQQLMEEDTFVKMTGSLAQRLMQDMGMPPELVQMGMDGMGRPMAKVAVSPMDLLVHYDVLEHDGTIPGSENTDGLIDVFQTLAQQPVVGAQFNMVNIMKSIARGLGVKNIDDYILQQPIQVMPDEQVLAGAQAGNFAPYQGDGV